MMTKHCVVVVCARSPRLGRTFLGKDLAVRCLEMSHSGLHTRGGSQVCVQRVCLAKQAKKKSVK